MNDDHRPPTRGWRPEVEDYEAARDELQERGHNTTVFLNAVLRWFNHNPTKALNTLKPHWPEPRPLGRPRLPNNEPPTDDT